jgi:putative aldouronate transport system substrate-binding protein
VETSQDSAAAGSDALKEKVKLTFMTSEYSNAPIDPTVLSYAELAKRMNVEFEFQLVPGDQYEEKVNMVIAAKELPDFMKAQPSQVSKYYDDGVFVQLNDLYEQYGQNALKEFEKYPGMLQNLKDDKGRMFVLPRIDSSGVSTIDFINKDYLDKIGKDVPKTTDELYTVLKEFKNLDKGTSPWVGAYYCALEQHIYEAFGTSTEWLAYKGEMNYGPYTLQDRTKEALQYLNKCYSEGLIDKEYFSLKAEDVLAKMKSGKAGMFGSWQDGAGMYAKGGEFGINYVPLVAIAGPHGDRLISYREPISDTFLITTASKHPERVMQIYDYMATDEGNTLMNWGVEGDTFVIKDGKKVYTDKVLKHEAGVINGRRYFGLDPIFVPYIMDLDSWGQSVSEPVVKLIDELKAFRGIEYPSLASTAEETKRLAEIMTDINTLVTENFQKFIVGKLDINKDWDGMIDKMKKMGIDEAVSIKRAQYDRWKNR